jgi:hypothetical protein
MIEYAFPHEEWINSTDPNLVNPVRHKGMTLRDYFAAKAMQSMLALPDNKRVPDENISQWAYETADAMLKERNK